MTKKILDELCRYLKLKNNKELAEYLGISPTRVYSWKKYGKITDVGLILVKNPELNPGWLYTGEGEMLETGQKNNSIGKEQKILATIEPGSARKKGVKAETQQARQETEAIDEDEAIEQTRYVLRSDTEYRGALVSNIRAFYQGVRREEEMAGVDEQMIEMQNKMDMMMQMLESLGAHLPGKKRDAQEG